MREYAWNKIEKSMLVYEADWGRYCFLNEALLGVQEEPH
jgi:hypothetical protein